MIAVKNICSKLPLFGYEMQEHGASTASHNEFDGIRYTIKIGRAVKYLYRDGRRWYVDYGP